MQTIDLAGEADTDRLGRRLAERLPDGATLALVGPLGAGKTRLCRAIAETLGVPSAEIHSPTFVIVKEYHGRRELHHLDLYRVRDDDELDELGLDEILAGPTLKLIEWADRFPHRLPHDRVELRLTPTGANSRRVEVFGGNELDLREF